MKANLSSLQTKIMPIVFGFALFAIAFSAIKGMMFGNLTNVKLVAALIVSAGIVLALDKNYWYLFPFCFIVGVKIPGIPFDGKELGSILLVVMYAIRLALHKERTIKPPLALSLCFPFLLWIFVVWCMNPTGIAMFGSKTIGGRFYLQIVLGVFAASIMCTKAINEKDARMLFFIIVLSYLINALLSIFSVGFLAQDENANQSEGQYQYLFAMYFYMLMFSRYSLSDIFNSGWKFLLVSFLAILTIYTGKRRGIGTLLFLPLLRVFLTGKDKVLTFACVCITSFMLFFVVAADGAFYDLPKSVQRSLSVVVPKYRKSEVVLDVFRYEVRKIGDDIIRESPWFGRQGFAMDFRETVWIVGQDVGVNYYVHAYSGNWHSTWYAYACDFGLPCAILFAIPFLYMLFYSFKVLKQCKYGSWSFACVLFYSLQVYIFSIFSYTSGHSAGSTVSIMYYLGFLVALDNGIKQNKINI